MFRHKDLKELRDVAEEDPLEVEAIQVRAELHQARRQHRLHGERRRPGHGHHGHHPVRRRHRRRTSSTWAAAPTRSRSSNAFEILLTDKNVKADLHQHLRRHPARGHAGDTAWSRQRESSMSKFPIVLRLEGTNVEEGRKILKESGLNSIVGADHERRSARRSWRRRRE